MYMRPSAPAMPAGSFQPGGAWAVAWLSWWNLSGLADAPGESRPKEMSQTTSALTRATATDLDPDPAKISRQTAAGGSLPRRAVRKTPGPTEVTAAASARVRRPAGTSGGSGTETAAR